MEQQENIHPNPGSPDLADVIRDNIHYQLDQSIKRTLMKESMLKISLDKDFKDLFEAAQMQGRPQTPLFSTDIPSKPTSLLQVTEQIKEICHWLEESDQFCGMAYLPFNSMARLVNILHQKIEGTAIIVTQYPTFWVGKMQEMGRLNKLKWGLLSANQQAEDKVRVLQFYELKKLKLLFITPNLFKCEQYHEFECDLLILGDLHLYKSQSSFLSRIISKTNPNRVLGLYHTLMTERYKEHQQINHMVEINKARSNLFNFIVLKATTEDKFRSMMAYLAKNQFKKVLIVVSKRQEAYNLNKKLIMENKSSINLFDYLSPVQMASFMPDQMINKVDKDKEQEKLFELFKRIANCEITITKNADFLRFCNFDVAVYYSFTDVPKFVETCFTTKQKLMLFEENDYHNYRNWITSDIVTRDSLQRIVVRMVQRPQKREEQSKKRFYSDHVDDKLMDCFTVSKQFAQKDQEKVLRLNAFCRKYEISPRLFAKVLQALEKNGVVGINYRTIYEIQIDMDSIPRLKKQLPMIEQIRRKVNLLNVSTKLHKTVRSILDDLKKEGIKYKVTQEAIQIKLLKSYEDIDWQSVNATVNAPVINESANLDKSFEIFKDCAYSSIELTKREKALQKKELMLQFLRTQFKENSNSLDSLHRSNLLTTEIEEWLRHCDDIGLNQHDLVLILQGVQKGKVSRFKDDSIFGRYRKLKYEELMEAVVKIFSNKRVKLE